VQRTLDESALGAGVEVLGHAFALDLVTRSGEPTASDRSQGSGSRSPTSTGAVSSVGLVTARAVVAACGGYGQVFASTSNPPAVTGDGVALALRAGLAVTDVEFVQFHPTVMWTGPDATGQQALVSEAVRGEGAILYDAAGHRVMAGVHPLEDLAPRDVVAAAITRRMAEGVAGVDDHVYLDATHLGEHFYGRFPSITAACRELGLDPARDRIPVAPASHYACGGIRAGLDGRTSLRGFFAAGEVSRTGVHGANRLASNSLTELGRHRNHLRGGPTMTTLTCTDCGFDGSRWSDDDIERTVAHADDLIGYVLEGADDDFVADVAAMPPSPPAPRRVGACRDASPPRGRRGAAHRPRVRTHGRSRRIVAGVRVAAYRRCRSPSPRSAPPG
jgi:hypothetical protein